MITRDPTGSEQQQKAAGILGVTISQGAKSGAVSPELKELIESWSRLSTADRSAVLGLLRSRFTSCERAGGKGRRDVPAGGLPLVPCAAGVAAHQNKRGATAGTG